MHAPFTVDGRRSLRRSLAASVAVAGMVRALNPGEATGMASLPVILMAPPRVSHHPPRRQLLCTSTKATGTSDKTTVNWSSARAAALRVLTCGLRASYVYLAMGVSGHARTGRGEATRCRARARGATSVCLSVFSPCFPCCCYKSFVFVISYCKKGKSIPIASTRSIRESSSFSGKSVNETEAGWGRHGFFAIHLDETSRVATIQYM